MSAPPIEALRTQRSALFAAGPTPGSAWCRALTAAVDRALVDLSAPVVGEIGVTVAAVGGYGRRELVPGSDVDLLILHSGLDDDRLGELVKTIVYPLWDVGLQVGYAVRDAGEAREHAREDLLSATAMLDARPLCGDVALLRRVRADVIADLRGDPEGFFLRLADADRVRRRAGSSAEALEPGLKSGAGSLRDVQSLRWAASALLGEPTLDALVSARYLGAPDRSRLARAYEQLLATRVALHLEVGAGVDRPGAPADDVLQLQVQQRVAERLGHRDGADDRDTAAHRLLTDHYLAARTIDHIHRRAWVLLRADATEGRRRTRTPQMVVDGFEFVDGVVHIPDDVEIGAVDVDGVLFDPDLPMRLFAVLVELDAVLDRRTAMRVRRAVVARDGEPWPWTASGRRRFLAALWRGSAMLDALAELDDTGLLTSLLPEWEPLRGRAQRNPFHLYSLDRHAWHAAAELGDLVRTEEWASSALERVHDRDAMLLGALLHDVGKAHGEPHSITGIPVARALAERLGVSRSTLDRIGSMVELHLLLPDVATKRDLAAIETAQAVAEAVPDAELLSCLHLLSAADGRATGPSAWSSWKASLIHSLVNKVRAVMERRDVDELDDGAVRTAEEAQRLAPSMGVDADVVRAHLRRLSPRYAATVDPRALVRHAGIAEGGFEVGEVRTRVTPGDEGEDGVVEFDRLDVVAMDSPGLFAKVAGVLALHGGSVVEAHAFTRDDDVAVDLFVVERPQEIRGSWWAAIEGDIDEAVAGRLALRARVSRKARGEARRIEKLPDVATRIDVETSEDGAATVVEVHTMDRLGVLFEIVTALAELELNIVLAKIQTLGHEVVDVFYVRNAAGEALDAHHVDELRLAITAALEF